MKRADGRPHPRYRVGGVRIALASTILSVAACGVSDPKALSILSDASDPNVVSDASGAFDATWVGDVQADAVLGAALDVGSVDAPEPSLGVAVMLSWPPDGGIFLDGSCPYDASWSPDDGTTSDDAGDADLPLSHRPTASCCPVTRPAGTTCEPDAAVAPAACFTDSDCTQGTNGRCLALPRLVPPGGGLGPSGGCNSWCTYDECFSDSDCPGHVPCDCRSIQFGANVCVTGSRCAVDSDCGNGGYCTRDNQSYYCHRPGDLCFNASDCPPAEFGSRCTFQTTTGQWACVPNPTPPGYP